MLVLTTQPDDKIHVFDDDNNKIMTLVLLSNDRRCNQVKLGFDAPSNIHFLRDKVLQREYKGNLKEETL